MLPDYRNENPYQDLLAHGLEAEGCRVTFPQRYRRVFPLYLAARDEKGVEILHLHWTSRFLSGRSLPGFSVRLAKFLAELAAVRMAGCRIVWTLHNLLPHDAQYRRLEMFARRGLCRMASAVIVHGRAGQADAVRTLGCPADRVFVIPHGHYRGAYGPLQPSADARRRLGLSGQARVILFFGFLRPYKGLELLLSAWRKLNVRDAILLLAGESLIPGYTAELARLIQATPGVRHLDRFAPPDEVAVLFSAADAVVLPFRAVQTSGSVLLAMSYGRPVIAPRLGELPETLGDAADLLFTPGDEDDLRRQLSRALTLDLTDLARRTGIACDRLDWGPIAAATAEVYRRALSGGRRVESGQRVRRIHDSATEPSPLATLPEITVEKIVQ
jgi:glycosyltransferase involved in cell wall biosynthesis